LVKLNGRNGSNLSELQGRLVPLGLVLEALERAGVSEEQRESVSTVLNLEEPLFLDQIAEEYGVAEATLHAWLSRGRMLKYDSVPNPGHGKKVRVLRMEVIEAINNPRRRVNIS